MDAGDIAQLGALLVLGALGGAIAVQRFRRRSRSRSGLAQWAEARGWTLAWGRGPGYVVEGRLEEIGVELVGEPMWMGGAGQALVTQVRLRAPHPGRPRGFIGYATEGGERTGDADFDARLGWFASPQSGLGVRPDGLEHAGVRARLLALEEALASRMDGENRGSSPPARTLFQIDLDAEHVRLMTFYVGEAALLDQALSVLVEVARARP